MPHSVTLATNRQLVGVRMDSDHGQPRLPIWQSADPVIPRAGGLGPMGRPLPPSTNSERIRPVADLGGASSVLLCLTVLTYAIGSANSWYSYQLVQDYLAGEPTVTDSDLYQADRFALIAGVLIAALMIVTAVVFLWWLRRARVNAELLSYTPHRHGRGWVVGAWVCPVVNLWFPKQVVDDIWRGSDPAARKGAPTPPDGGRTNGLTLLWWSTWIASLVLARIGTSSSDLTVDSMRRAAMFGTVGTVLSAVAAVALVLVIRQITTWQAVSPDVRHQPGDAPPNR